MATAPLKVVVVLSKFDKASKVLQGLNAAAPYMKMVPGMDQLFPAGKGDASQIISALEALGDRLETSLDKVKEAVNNQTYITLWLDNRKKLLDWRDRVLDRAKELSSLDKAETRVLVNSVPRSIEDWCDGFSDKGKHTDGVLEELGTILDDIDSWLRTEGESNPIAQWDKLVEAGVVEKLLGLVQETRFSQMFLWYQSLSQLIQTATYVRNAALAMYLRRGKTNQENLDVILGRLGDMADPVAAARQGDTADPGNDAPDLSPSWMAFREKFESLSVPMIGDHNRLAAINSNNDPANHHNHFSDDHRILTGGFRMRGGSNCYIAGLEIGYGDETTYDGSKPAYKGWKLMATVVKLMPDGTQKVWREVEDGPITKAGFGALWQVNAHDRRGIGAGERLGVGTVDPPSISLSPNQSLVVTGWGVQHHHGAFVIALEYGMMTIDAKGRVSVTGIGSEENGPLRFPKSLAASFRLHDDVCELHRGRAGTRSLLPLTDATFIESSQYYVSLRARCAWTAYRAETFQPAYLKKYPPVAPPPKAPAPTGTAGAGGAAGQASR